MTIQIIVGYLRLMQRTVQHYQIDVNTLGIPVDILARYHSYLDHEQSNDFDVEQYVVLLVAIQAKFERPISLVIAEQVALSDIGLMGYLASTSVDLQQALQLLEEYYSLLYKQTNTEALNIVMYSETIKIYWRAEKNDWCDFYELNLALLFKVTQLIVQNTLTPPDKIVLGYQPKYALMHYERFFNCSVRYETQSYAIHFPQSVLSTRSVSADWQLNRVLSNQAQKSLYEKNEAIQQQQFKQKILRLLDVAFKQSQSIQSYVAQELHCSERTLQRQLKSLSLNFQNIVDEYRYERSKYYLLQGKSLIEIAELLKYADQSAFGRAFKRWTGQTPKQYLKTQQN